MAHHNAPVQEDPQQLAEAQAFWHHFTKFAKWSTIVTAIILSGLAAAFVHF